MPIRLSGMVSGMDTESLVTALVSGSVKERQSCKGSD